MGIIFLLVSLPPTQQICQRQNQREKGWKWACRLVLFFLVGYCLYLILLFRASPTTQDMIIATILLSGSIFVMLVTRLSLATICRIEQQTQRELHRALHDELTGLPNRILMEERLDHGILHAKRKGESLALLLMDLVRFKDINDSLGHSYGDYLLQEVSQRMGTVIKESDTLSRFSGDKFGLVLPSTDLSQAVMISQKISDIVEKPFLMKGHNVNVGISIGIALYPEHGMNTEDLVLYADTAMYDAKRHEVNCTVFNTELDRTTFSSLIKIGELRKGMEEEQLFLEYQPKVAIQRGELVGVEALLRWRHPEKGIILPDEFIHLAEQAGLVRDLTRLVLDKSIEQCGLWHRAGLPISVSVNLSIKNLQDLDFPAEVRAILDKWKVGPKRLTLEITESCIVVNRERVVAVVKELESYGVRLSIDDFGTGYSSISYLKNFPAREVKIDKSFVTDMVHNQDNAVIVKSTIDMLHNIGNWVVAEGVEDEETQNLLTELGCDVLQGFYVCKPLSPQKFTQWLQSTSWRVKAGD